MYELIHDFALVGLGLFGSLLIAIVFKRYIIPEEAKLYRENVKQTIDLIFDHLSYVDHFKSEIYEIMGSKIITYGKKQSTKITVNNDELTNIKDLINNIKKEIYKLSYHERYSTYVTINQYISILKYSYSAITFLTFIDNDPKIIYIDEKNLDYHKYYAKMIIEEFGDKINKNFKTKWMKCFENIGGINSIYEPTPEPGDIVGYHWNVRNEMFHNNSHHFIINEKLDRVIEKLEFMHVDKKTKLDESKDL